MSVGILSSSLAFAGPEGGVVVGGTGNIQYFDSNTTIVEQQTGNLALDWQSFNLGTGDLIRFNQPSASSVVMNRIIDQNPSQIFGTIEANGRVFLSNPNGMIFGKTATVNVGSLVATSLQMETQDFMAGNYRLYGDTGFKEGSIINRGLIQAATGGNVALIGKSVSNEGVIQASLGNVILASGKAVTLDFDGNGMLQFKIDEEIDENLSGVEDAVANSGLISADGGNILLTAGAAKDVFSNVVNNTGIIEAATIENKNGIIRLMGVGSGVVANSGSLLAQGVDAGETGGNIQVLGEKVGLFDGSRIDASGEAGGGEVLIGGDFQGSNTQILNADYTFVGKDTEISVDAITSGGGGKVIVWADKTTRYFGDIDAKGGAEAGDGGFVEVSGKENLIFDGGIDTGAAKGVTGKILLDPQDLTIDNMGVNNGADYHADGEVAFAEPDVMSSLSISAAAIRGLTGDITLQAHRDLSITEALNLTNQGGGESVVFVAGRSLTVDATVQTDGATLSFIADDFRGLDDGSGTLTINAAVGDNNTGNVTFTNDGSGAIVLNADVQSAGNVQFDHGVTIGANVQVTAVTPIIGGTVNLQANTLTLNHSNAASISTVISGTGGLTKTGSGTMTLSGQSTYTGPTTLDSGSIELSADNVIQNGSDLTLKAGTVFSLNGYDLSIGSLDNSGTLKLQGGEAFSIATMDTNSGVVMYTGNGDGVSDAFTINDFGAFDYYNLVIDSSTGIADQFQTTSGLVLNELIVENSAGMTFNQDVTADTITLNDSENGSNIVFQGSVNINTLTTTDNLYNLRLNGGSTITNSVIFRGINNLSIGNNTNDAFLFAGGLDTTGVTGTVTLAGKIRTSGNLADFGGVTLGAATTIDTTNNLNTLTGANVNIAAVTGGNNNLILNSGDQGAIAVTGVVNGVNTLDITNSNGATFDSVTVTTLDISDTEDGRTVKFQGDVSANTLTTTANAYNLQFDEDLTITNDVTFAAIGNLSIGNETADVALFKGGVDMKTVTGRATLAGNLRTSAAQADFNDITLGSDTIIDTTNNGIAAGGANVNLGAVDRTPSNYNLTILTSAPSSPIRSLGVTKAMDQSIRELGLENPELLKYVDPTFSEDVPLYIVGPTPLMVPEGYECESSLKCN